MRPWEFAQRSMPDEANESECEMLGPPAPTAKDPACFITKGGHNDGFGHQLFGTLSIMGAHGVLGRHGHCYVFNATSRSFMFQHVQRFDEAWNESETFMTALYVDFRSKIGPRGCATASLIGRAPARTVPMCTDPMHLGHVACHEDATFEIDNVWFGWSGYALEKRKLQAVTPFMRAVVQNATRLAALAADHLPPQATKASLAVHMRFQDRAQDLESVAFGQQKLFTGSKLAQSSPVQVFTDNPSDARHILKDTDLAGAELLGPDRTTVVQAMARMVGAEVFVGSRSDVSSSAALMRIGLGKKGTFMPAGWQWANSFSEKELTLYPEVGDEFPAVL